MEKITCTTILDPNGVHVRVVGRVFRSLVREKLETWGLRYTEYQDGRVCEFIVPLPDGKDTGHLRAWLNSR